MLVYRSGESGNIFFMLFGAVALVGIVGVATSNLIRGPLGTALALNQKAKIDSQLQIALKLTAMEATSPPHNCEGASETEFLEPIEPETVTPAACNGLITGGGCLPQNVGAAKLDSWGTLIGYCGWNHGPDTTTGCPKLLKGVNNNKNTVLAVISAGPDRIFQTSCVDYDGVDADGNGVADNPLIQKGGDDVVFDWTYAQVAEGVGDGLWSLKSGDPAAITTAKNVEFASGTTATFGSDAVLDLTGGGLFNLPNESVLTNGDCNAANKGVLRRFTNQPTNDQEILQICDGTNWQAAAAGTIDGLTDAYTDYVTTHNMIMGRPSAGALAAGAVSNTFIGDSAGATTAHSTATTDYNTALGYLALNALTSGMENTATGESALKLNTSGNENAAYGSNSLNDNTSGSGNTAYGDSTLRSNVGKSESTAIGYQAMSKADPNSGAVTTYNTAVGAYALQGSNTPTNNTGLYNTAIGHSAIKNVTSGERITAIGYASLFSNTTGTDNTAVGSNAAEYMSTGSSNTAFGAQALRSLSGPTLTGSQNTAIGKGAGTLVEGAANCGSGHVGKDCPESVIQCVQIYVPRRDRGGAASQRKTCGTVHPGYRDRHSGGPTRQDL